MSKHTILLVDDEERILRSLRMLFLGTYEIRMTTDANEAIRILCDECVHVIVSDQRMPIMLGVELLRTAREISPATMRILLTGYSDLNASIASVNEGEIFRYLLKPWNAEEVRQVVSEAAAIAETSFSILQSSAPAVVAPQEKICVLVMDDDEGTVRAVNEALQQRGNVIWADNIDHATDVLAHENVAIVVSDLMLGGKSTAFMLKSLKQSNPKTQSIIVTSLTDTSKLIDLINQAQISRFLPKPISKNLLERNLEHLIERFHAMEKMPLLQKRHAVSPIQNPQEKEQANNFMGLIGRLRSRLIPGVESI